MSENGMAEAEETTAETSENKQAEEIAAETPEAPENTETAAAAESISYQAVEKEGSVTAIWEMQGRKHIRTIDPRSNEGKQILALFETAA